MLKSAAEAAIMETARQPNLRDPRRSVVHYDAIVEDFNLAGRFANCRLLDLGPGHFDFCDVARAGGASVVGIDNDPAVVTLGKHRGIEAHELNIEDIGPDSLGGAFDALFCRWSFNAMWFADDDARHLAWAGRLAAMLARDGWAWLAPWNYLATGSELTRRRYLEVLQVQLEGMALNGFLGFYLPPDVAARYGLSRGQHFQEGEML